MSFCKEKLAFRLCCSRSIQDTKDSDGACACSSLETGCQNIFMQEVVSLKNRFIDMGQHPTGSWVNESLICRDKTELYSLLVIWLPKEIQAFVFWRLCPPCHFWSQSQTDNFIYSSCNVFDGGGHPADQGWGDAAVVLCSGALTGKALPDSHKWRSPPSALADDSGRAGKLLICVCSHLLHLW